MSTLRPTSIAAILAATFLSLPNLSFAAPQAASSPQPSQTSSEEPATTVFRTNVRRVVVDVVVTDSNGKAVPGLKKQDFSVTEDHKPQQILSFDANGFNPGMDYLPPNLPPEPPNTFLNLPKTPEKGPLYVLLYDLVNMDNEDQMTLTVNQHQDQIFGRQQLIKFIQSKPEGSRFAIFVRSDGLHLIQGFTSDKQLLLAAVDPRHPGPHIPQVFLMGQNWGRGDVISAMEVLRYLAEYLDGLPGRKNLIWFSGGFPLTLFPSSEDVPTYAEQVKATLDLVARDQIAIYPVDVRGVVLANWKSSTADLGGEGEIVSDRGKGAPGAGAGTQAALKQSAGTGNGLSLLAGSYQVEDAIARDTGGRAFYSNNDVAGALTDAAEAGASYYTITYAPSDENYDGRMRSIKVELDKKGYKLAYRRSYFGSNSDTAPAFHLNQVHKSKPSTAPPAPRKLGDTLYANMEHGAPIAHQLIFGAHVRTVGPPAMGSVAQMAELATQPAYFKVRRKSAPAKPLPPIELQRYVIDYTLLARQLQVGGASINVELAAAAYDPDGKMLNAIVDNGEQGTANGSSDQPSKSFRAEQSFEVPLPAAWIRIAVRDANTDRIGAMEIKLPLAPENESAAAKPN